MNYTEALEYIHGISWTFCKPGLERIGELCEKLGHPEKSLKFIHVAGTNGKGSFCSMLDSVLRAEGYKVGLYTSPYVKRFNERMKVDGVDIPDDVLARITGEVKPIADSMLDKPTEFELITAIAFMYFKEAKCDAVILEAGMGGRLDSTNIIRHPLLSVITGIALDHTAFLGDTVEKIAAEKAGIIKDGAPVLYGGESDEARAVIRNVADEVGSDFFDVDYSALNIKSATLEGATFDYKTHTGISISLLGLYQPKNSAVVIEALERLRKAGLKISDEAMRCGLKCAKWPARFEIMNKDPLIIFDGAHNAQGITSAVESIKQYFANERVYVLSGVLKDKDYEFIAGEIASVADRVFTITPDNPRALTAEEYAEVLENHGVRSTPCENIEAALAEATRAAKRDGRALISLGSLYTYVDVCRVLNK